MKARDFQSIAVIDREGMVRATSAGSTGLAYRAPASEALGERKGGVTVTRFTADGESVLGFEAPITFQDKRVGSVSLGLPEKPLIAVARLSIGLMVALVVTITVLAVAVAMFFVANWFAQPTVARESMQEIGRVGSTIALPSSARTSLGNLRDVRPDGTGAGRPAVGCSRRTATPTPLPTRADSVPLRTRNEIVMSARACCELRQPRGRLAVGCASARRPACPQLPPGGSQRQCNGDAGTQRSFRHQQPDNDDTSR
jgi:hypothetical protein